MPLFSHDITLLDSAEGQNRASGACSEPHYTNQNQNQKLVYCQVGFHMQKICFSGLVHNGHNEHSKRKEKTSTVKDKVIINIR